MSSSARLLRRDGLTSNPNVFAYPLTSDINITSHGADLYWAVSAVMGFSALAFLAHAHFWVPRQHGDGFQFKIFHYITASICFVACIAYFTMASNLGYAAIPVEFQRDDPLVRGLYREIFYVRYIDWFVTTPLLLLDVLLTAGLPWPTILITILADEIMIITGLVGALVSSQYKWGYFVFAMLSLFFIFYNVTFVGQAHAKRLTSSNNTNIGATYRWAATWTMGLWFLYPIAWGLSEGGNVISPDSEAIFYSVLDVLAKPGFGAILIYFHRHVRPADIGIHIRDYDSIHRDAILHESNDHEKGHQDAPGVQSTVPGNGTRGVDAGNGHFQNGAQNNGNSSNGALPADANNGAAEPRMQVRSQA